MVVEPEHARHSVCRAIDRALAAGQPALLQGLAAQAERHEAHREVGAQRQRHARPAMAGRPRIAALAVAPRCHVLLSPVWMSRAAPGARLSALHAMAERRQASGVRRNHDERPRLRGLPVYRVRPNHLSSWSRQLPSVLEQQG